jgi:hypothetical protein
MAHAKLPTLCPSCEREAQSLAEMFPANQIAIQACEHYGALAVGQKHEGTIAFWQVRGPYTAEELVRVMAKLAAELEEQGTPVKPVSRQ